MIYISPHDLNNPAQYMKLSLSHVDSVLSHIPAGVPLLIDLFLQISPLLEVKRVAQALSHQTCCPM
jgi:hypothetical protein